MQWHVHIVFILGLTQNTSLKFVLLTNDDKIASYFLKLDFLNEIPANLCFLYNFVLSTVLQNRPQLQNQCF